MPTPKVRQTPQSRVEKIFREQGFGLVLGLFAVVLAFVFVPVFVVDDLLYVHTVAPEVEGRGHAARPPAHLKHVHVHPHNHTNASVTSGASEAGRVGGAPGQRHRAPPAPSCRIAGRGAGALA